MLGRGAPGGFINVPGDTQRGKMLLVERYFPENEPCTQLPSLLPLWHVFVMFSL